MRAIAVVAFLVVLVTFADCLNWEKQFTNSVASRVERNEKRADSFCPHIQCQAAGATCRRDASPSCSACISNYATCVIATNDTNCECTTILFQCGRNVTDDPSNCSPGALSIICGSLTPACGCGASGVIPTCNQEQYCSNATNKCEDKTGLGQTCYDDEDCNVSALPGASYTCENGKCAIVSGTMSIGDMCTATSDCVNSMYNEVSCVSGVCVGQNLGGNCTTDESCNFGLYCGPADTCVALLTEGATCELSNDNCAYPYVCGVGSKCTKIMTRTRGQSCEDTIECVSGNVCANDVCVATPPMKNCTTNSDCPISAGYDGQCSCNFFNGASECSLASSYPTQCINQITDFMTCVQNNKCAATGLASQCVQDNCSNEAQCYYQCGLDYFGIDTATCFPSLTCASTTGSTTGSAGAVQVSVGIVALAVAALTL